LIGHVNRSDDVSRDDDHQVIDNDGLLEVESLDRIRVGSILECEGNEYENADGWDEMEQGSGNNDEYGPPNGDAAHIRTVASAPAGSCILSLELMEDEDNAPEYPAFQPPIAPEHLQASDNPQIVRTAVNDGQFTLVNASKTRIG